MKQSRKSFIKTFGLTLGTTLSNLPTFAFKASQSAIKPLKLKSGDTIGMISPASSLPEEKEYAEIVKKIEELGFKVKIGPHAKDHFGYLAGTDKNRAADLNAMFNDNSVNAIIPFRGGWGCNRILDFIDFDMIKNNPKPLIGFSDITSLLLSIYTKTGLITYHGPVGSSDWSPFTRSYFRKAVMYSRPFDMKNHFSEENHPEITTIHEGKASGRLLGGNLSVLTAMLGSDYLPDWENSILFIEDVGEDIYRIDRMFTQLHLNGVFKKINGLVFGKCTECEVSTGYHFTLEQIVANRIKDYEIPAFVGANIGHIKNLFTVPIGVHAQINAHNGTIKLLEAPIK